MIYKRAKVYWMDFSVHGQRVRKTTETSNRTLALQIEYKLKSEMLEGKIGIRKSPIFGEFLDEFLTWSNAQSSPPTYKRYCVSSKPIRSFFTGPLDRIDSGWVERFKVRRLEDCSPAGVNRDLAALKFMCNFAIRQGYINRNPVQGVKFLKEGPGNMRILSYEEERMYLLAANPLLRDVAVLILETGMRPGEVYTIKRENVHVDYIFVPDGKSRFARRNIPLSERAKQILRSRKNTGPYLFPHRADRSKPMTEANRGHELTIQKLPFSCRIYDLRHTFGPGLL